MSCYNPMIRIEFPNVKRTKTGKITQQALIMSETQFRLKYGDRPMKNNETKIGCGQCIGCRLEYSRQWANRITLEAKKYKPDECWFLTLTYDDEHVPIGHTVNQKTGEIKQSLTLNKEDLTLFIKRLRKQYKYHYNHDGIRFYAAGEYGETTRRPHYHICIFNMPIHTELIRIKENELGQRIWTNKEIEKIWGKGFIAIAHQSWETAAYTARYMLKKTKRTGCRVVLQKPGNHTRIYADEPETRNSQGILRRKQPENLRKRRNHTPERRKNIPDQTAQIL